MLQLTPQDINLAVSELAEIRHDQKELPFPVEEYEHRHELVQQRMANAGIDLLVVSSPEGTAWLTGHSLRWNKGQGPSAWPALQCYVIRAGHDRPILFETADHEYLIRTRSVVEDFRLSVEEDLDSVLGHIVGELNAEKWISGVVGIEKQSYIPNRLVSDAVESALRDNGASDVIDASLLMRTVRSAKSDREIALIEQATMVVDTGLLALEAAIKPGVREIDLWLEMMRGMVEAGGEPSALHELVSFKLRSGHAFSGDRRLKRGDYIHADPCGVVHHYHSNVAMTWYIGELSQEARNLNTVTAGAYDVLTNIAKAGATYGEVSTALHTYYVDSGSWDAGIHEWTGGYEMGLSFPPDWVGEEVFTVGEHNDSQKQFLKNQVFNFESMVFHNSIDTFVVGETGSRTLSTLPHGVKEVDF